MSKSQKPKAKTSKVKPFPRVTEEPSGDGGVKVATDDGVFARQKTVYRGADGLKAFASTLVDAPDGTKLLPPLTPSAKGTLGSLKETMRNAFEMEAKERTWDAQLRSDADRIVVMIGEAEHFIETERWDVAGGMLFNIGRALAQFELLEGMGPLVRQKRQDNERTRLPRATGSVPVLEFQKKFPAWRDMSPLDAVKKFRAVGLAGGLNFVDKNEHLKSFKRAFKRAQDRDKKMGQ